MSEKRRARSRLARWRPAALLLADASAFVALAFVGFDLALRGAVDAIDGGEALLGSTMAAAGIPLGYALTRGDRWLESRERWWDQVLGSAALVTVITC